ncbi:unnamed protein product, partial [Allacma fusca]
QTSLLENPMNPVDSIFIRTGKKNPSQMTF